MTKRAIMLIGLPGSGKSTFIKNLLSKAKMGEAWRVLSTDDILEEWGKERGMSYNEAFQKINFKSVKNEMFRRFKEALENGENIIFDQTNMSVKSRAEKLKELPEDYAREAVVFSLTDAELNRRLKKREAETGKVIPPFVIANMAKSYEAPSKDEFPNGIKFIRE